MLGASLNRTRMALVLTATMDTASAAIGGVRDSSDATHVIVPEIGRWLFSRTGFVRALRTRLHGPVGDRASVGVGRGIRDAGRPRRTRRDRGAVASDRAVVSVPPRHAGRVGGAGRSRAILPPPG